jgi:hypothetical protein
VRWISVSDIAELTGTGRGTVAKRLRAAGLAGRDGPKNSRLFESVPALRVAFGFDSADLDPAQERAKLDRTRRRLAELQIAEREGTLVARAAVTEQWAATLLILRQKLLAQPTRFAAAIGTTAEERAHIEHEAKLCVRALLTELSTPAGEHVHVEETSDPVG